VDAVEEAIRNFQNDLQDAESRLADREAEYGNHTHGFVCFRWRRCQRLERQISAAKWRIDLYRKALQGLEREDYEPAIAALDAIIPMLEESPLQAALRTASTSSQPSLAATLSGPAATQAGMIRLRNRLASLSGLPAVG
jgi:hypothetical protein